MRSTPIERSVLLVRLSELTDLTKEVQLMNYIPGPLLGQPGIRHVVLLGEGIHLVNRSLVRSLLQLQRKLKAARISLHLASVSPAVLNQMEKVGLLKKLGARQGRVFLTPRQAIEHLEPSFAPFASYHEWDLLGGPPFAGPIDVAVKPIKLNLAR
jgi:anti-anti-sigma regulatory factor